MNKDAKNDVIVINKKSMVGIAPSIAIIAILLSRHEPGPLLLFITGIACGILIGIFSKK